MSYDPKENKGIKVGFSRALSSLRSVTSPTPGEVKTSKEAQKRKVLQKGFRCESSLYWPNSELRFGGNQKCDMMYENVLIVCGCYITLALSNINRKALSGRNCINLFEKKIFLGVNGLCASKKIQRNISKPCSPVNLL